MKSRAEGTARDFGGEYIKNDLDAKDFQPLRIQYIPCICQKHVITVNEMQHFFKLRSNDRMIAEKVSASHLVNVSKKQTKWIFINFFVFF